MTSHSASPVEAIRAELRSEPRLDVHRYPVDVEVEDGIATLEGEVGSVAMKKLALKRTAAVAGVTGIVDRLRVVPAERQGDGAILDQLCDALVQEPAFRECILRRRVGHEDRFVQQPLEPRGDLHMSVDDGVVTLDGEVPSLSHKRLAGVLAWWVPGSRDVINGLAVEPEEQDNDDEVSDAVRLVLEKDPFVDASQLRVRTRDYAVTLRGLVPTESERHMAEFDAWYIFGVDQVINEIDVRP